MLTFNDESTAKPGPQPSKQVAIHQPNFLPWLGYFDKIAKADVFVLLDDAQFPKTGGTWCNRVRLMSNGHADWATVPVIRNFHGTRRINEMKINDQTPWREKFLRGLTMNYAKAPFFKEIYRIIEGAIHFATDDLAAFNTFAIRLLCEGLGLDTGGLVSAASLHCSQTATERLIEIVRGVGGTSYLCGAGAGGYQEDAAFAAAGVQLIYQDFRHPEYRQVRTPEFVPGLSIVDALMNCGFEGTRPLIGSRVGETR